MYQPTRIFKSYAVDYHRLGDKKQLKSQDVTARLVRIDILRLVPKNILFCIGIENPEREK